VDRFGVKYSEILNLILWYQGGRIRALYSQMPVRLREDMARFGMSARGGPRGGELTMTVEALSLCV
jgi:hypothetical protein